MTFTTRSLLLALSIIAASLVFLPGAAAVACTTPDVPVGACAGTDVDDCKVWIEGDAFRVCVPACEPASSCGVASCTDGGIGISFRGDCHMLVNEGDPVVEDCGEGYVTAGAGEYVFECYPVPTVHQCDDPGHYKIRWGTGGMPCWGFWIDIEVAMEDCPQSPLPAVRIMGGGVGCARLPA